MMRMRKISISKYYKLFKEMRDEIYIDKNNVKNKNIFIKFINKIKKKNTTKIPVDFDEDNCIICFETLNKNYLSLSCAHKYHPKCIKKWIKEKVNCPICRKNLTNKDYYQLTSKLTRFKSNSINFIKGLIEFVIVLPIFAIVDILCLAGQSVKLGFEIFVICLNVACCCGQCCCNYKEIKELHEDMWKNSHRFFGATRSYLTMVVCNIIRNYLEIRIPLLETLKLYSQVYNNNPQPNIELEPQVDIEEEPSYSPQPPPLILSNPDLMSDMNNYNFEEESSDLHVSYV